MKDIFIKELVDAVANKKATISYDNDLKKIVIGLKRKNDIRTTILQCSEEEYKQIQFLISYSKETRYHDLY